MKRRATILLIALCLWSTAVLTGCGERRVEIVQDRLGNDLVVIIKENRACPVVSVQAWVRDGALYERPEQAGLASLVSRLIFDRTPSREPGEIARLVEGSGGVIRSSATHDFTSYIITAPSDHMNTAIDLLADGVLRSVFDPGRVEKAKAGLVSEISGLRDRPLERAYAMCVGEMFGEHPYGRPAQGRAESVAALTPEQVSEHHRIFYVPNNMVVVVAGDFDPACALEQVKLRFSDYEAGELPVVELPAVVPPRSAARIAARGDVKRAYQVIGYPAPSVDDPDNVAMDVLLMLLGHGRSSRLNRVLNQELHLAEAINAGWYTTKDPGIFLIWMELEAQHVKAAEDVVVSLVGEVRDRPVPVWELEKAKTLLESQTLFLRETCEGQGVFYGYGTAIKDFDFAESYLEKAAQVSGEDLMRVAGKFLRPENRVTAALLPEWAK